MAQLVKNPPAMQEMQDMQVWPLGWKDPLEEKMATHSSILAWEIPWTKEPGGLQSMGSERVGPNWAQHRYKLCVCLVSQSGLTLWDPMDCSPPSSFVYGDSPGKNTGGGCHTLLQGIFLTQGWNPGLPHRRRILYRLSHQESLWMLGWVAYPFSRGSSPSRNRTGI